MPDFLQGQTEQTPGPSASEFIPATGKAEMAQQAVGPPTQPELPPAIAQGAGMGATQEDPINAPDEDASPEEQEAYQDLFMRVMAAVNDTKKPPKGETSPADAVIKMLSVKGKEAHVAIGTTAGMVITQMLDMAKRQGQDYPGPVVQEVGIDLVVELAEIADFSGAIENMPEEDSPEFEKLIELAALEGAKFFGEHQLSTGQADREGHMMEVQEQMQREADAGELDDWGMEEMDPQMRDQMAQQLQQQGGQSGP